MHFVTLFDSGYMSRGLVMYESLVKVLDDFTIYIVAFDNKVYRKLIELQLERAVIISMEQFEDEKLLKAKRNRTRGEYCWTCSSKAILYILEKYNVEHCTYIDADLYFFSDPTDILAEMTEEESVLITKHKYSDYCDQSKESGKYCVQFVTVKNTYEGLRTLRWWSERCLDWCYNRIEDGKFGDQKYLEEFPKRFNGIHEMKNEGGGIAPWNISQYTVIKEDKVYIKRKETNEKIPLVFYHFHALEFLTKDVVHLTANVYRIPDTAVTYIYKEYIKKTEEVCLKYCLQEEKECWMNQKQYRDADMDALQHNKMYYHYSLFT